MEFLNFFKGNNYEPKSEVAENTDPGQRFENGEDNSDPEREKIKLRTRIYELNTKDRTGNLNSLEEEERAFLIQKLETMEGGVGHKNWKNGSNDKSMGAAA